MLMKFVMNIRKNNNLLAKVVSIHCQNTALRSGMFLEILDPRISYGDLRGHIEFYVIATTCSSMPDILIPWA